MAQLALLIFTYGKLAQRVEDTTERVSRIEQKLDKIADELISRKK